MKRVTGPMAIYSKMVKNLVPLEKLSCEVCSHLVLSLGHIFMPSHPKAARIRVYSVKSETR